MKAEERQKSGMQKQLWLPMSLEKYNLFRIDYIIHIRYNETQIQDIYSTLQCWLKINYLLVTAKLETKKLTNEYQIELLKQY